MEHFLRLLSRVSKGGPWSTGALEFLVWSTGPDHFTDWSPNPFLAVELEPRDSFCGAQILFFRNSNIRVSSSRCFCLLSFIKTGSTSGSPSCTGVQMLTFVARYKSLITIWGWVIRHTRLCHQGGRWFPKSSYMYMHANAVCRLWCFGTWKASFLLQKLRPL